MQFKKFEVPLKGEGAGMFLKFSDGQTITTILRGEIHEFYTKWEGGKATNVVEGTPGAKVRFSVNAIIHDGSKFTAKVWDFGVAVYNQLSDIHDEYPLSTTKIKITRKGTGLDTTYNILPLLKESDQVTQKQLKEIESIPLNILDKKTSTQTTTTVEEDGWDGFEA